MQNLAFIGLGIGFVLMGGGLYALTLRKPQPVPAKRSKAHEREQAGLAAEARKMRLGAAILAGIGMTLVVASLI